MRSHELDPNQVVVYADALQDCDPSSVEEACRLLGLEERGEHDPAMPSVGTIRKKSKQVELVQRVSSRSLPSAKGDDPRTWFACFACEDNDWIVIDCPGGKDRTCGRPEKGHFVDSGNGRTAFQADCQYPHAYVKRCDHRLRAADPSVEWAR